LDQNWCSWSPFAATSSSFSSSSGVLVRRVGPGTFSSSSLFEALSDPELGACVGREAAAVHSFPSWSLVVAFLEERVEGVGVGDSADAPLLLAASEFEASESREGVI